MTPSLCLAALSLSLPWLACEGVRRQAAAMVPEARPSVRVQSFSKSVSMAPGADGQLHSFTRELQTTRVGEGAGAQVATLVRECKDSTDRPTTRPAHVRVLCGSPFRHPETLSVAAVCGIPLKLPEE